MLNPPLIDSGASEIGSQVIADIVFSYKWKGERRNVGFVALGGKFVGQQTKQQPDLSVTAAQKKQWGQCPH
jgi:hypothetical protein